MAQHITPRQALPCSDAREPRPHAAYAHHRLGVCACLIWCVHLPDLACSDETARSDATAHSDETARTSRCGCDASRTVMHSPT
eukprot:6383298-Prymnesium_polylepis.1